MREQQFMTEPANATGRKRLQYNNAQADGDLSGFEGGPFAGRPQYGLDQTTPGLVD